MGCDIHAHIEVANKKRCNHENYSANHFAKVSIGRDYMLFARMAGVRDWDNEVEHVSEPKGIPDKLSYQTKREFTCMVVDDEEYEVWDEAEGYCRRNDAEKWVEQGSSEWIDEHHITHPDWHSESWLSLEELEKVLELYCSDQIEDWDSLIDSAYTDKKLHAKMVMKFKENPVLIDRPPNRDLLGVIGAMRAIKDENHEPRLVFWFDN